MNTIVYHSGYVQVLGESAGRVGDYSAKAYVLVGVIFNSQSQPQEIRVFVGINEDRYHEGPNPVFTSSGGFSPNLYASLVEITRGKGRGESTLLASGDKGRLLLSRNTSGDFVISSVDENGMEYYTRNKFIHRLTPESERFADVYTIYSAMRKDLERETVSNTRNPTRLNLVPEELELFR
jgi:hypothetical protein